MNGCQPGGVWIQMSPDFPVLHRASWLLPMNSPPVPNGAVLLGKDSILASGPYETVKATAPSHCVQVDHGDAALLPALVNAHTHLELSGLRGKIPLPQAGFEGWLRELLAQRASQTPRQQIQGRKEGEREILSTGTGLYADIMNGFCLHVEPSEAFPVRQAFLEVLGFHTDALETALDPGLLRAFQTVAEGDTSFGMAAHACYSTSPGLIRKAKEWSRARERVFSMHVAEHEEELEFVRNGTGVCRQILEALGRWVPTWVPPKSSPIAYLDSLGVLDSRTLLVHAVHLTDADWEIVAARRCSVCFCPRSNQNLNSGRANVEKALGMGIPVSLGTDSLASNTDLSLFPEADCLLEKTPGLPPESVLSMMTMGGAAALKQEHRFGSLEPKRSSAILAVFLPERLPESELPEMIISQGKEGAWQWANRPKTN